MLKHLARLRSGKAGVVGSVFRKIICLLCLLWLSVSASAGCNEGLVIAYSNWPPYHYADELSEPAGLDIEILGNVLSTIGCAYTLRQVPWKRALRELEGGSVDVGLAASKNAERESFAWFSVPYRRESMVMFMRKSDPLQYSPHSLSDLADTDYTVGLVLGIWYGEDLEDLFHRKPGFRPRVLQQLENKSLLNGLVRGRVDIVVSDLFNGVFAARQDDVLAKIKVRPEIINDNDIHYMFSRKTVSAAELGRINATITAFQKTGSYRELMLKYVPAEYLDVAQVPN